MCAFVCACVSVSLFVSLYLPGRSRLGLNVGVLLDGNGLDWMSVGSLREGSAGWLCLERRGEERRGEERRGEERRGAGSWELRVHPSIRSSVCALGGGRMGGLGHWMFLCTVYVRCVRCVRCVICVIYASYMMTAMDFVGGLIFLPTLPIYLLCLLYLPTNRLVVMGDGAGEWTKGMMDE